MNKPYYISVHSVFPDGQAVEHGISADAYLLFAIESNEVRMDTNGLGREKARLIGMAPGILENVRPILFAQDHKLVEVTREIEGGDERIRKEEEALRERKSALDAHDRALQAEVSKRDRMEARILELENEIQRLQVDKTRLGNLLNEQQAAAVVLEDEAVRLKRDKETQFSQIAGLQETIKILEGKIEVFEGSWGKLLETAQNLGKPKATKRKRAA